MANTAKHRILWPDEAPGPSEWHYQQQEKADAAAQSSDHVAPDNPAGPVADDHSACPVADGHSADLVADEHSAGLVADEHAAGLVAEHFDGQQYVYAAEGDGHQYGYADEHPYEYADGYQYEYADGYHQYAYAAEGDGGEFDGHQYAAEELDGHQYEYAAEGDGGEFEEPQYDTEEFDGYQYVYAAQCYGGNEETSTPFGVSNDPIHTHTLPEYHRRHSAFACPQVGAPMTSLAADVPEQNLPDNPEDWSPTPSQFAAFKKHVLDGQSASGDLSQRSTSYAESFDPAYFDLGPEEPAQGQKGAKDAPDASETRGE